MSIEVPSSPESKPVAKEFYPEAEYLLSQEYEETPEFMATLSPAWKDAEIIKDTQFLEELTDLAVPQRMKFLSWASRQIYIEPNDFELYFQRFPDDAKAVVHIVMHEAGFGANKAGLELSLGNKVLEPAAKALGVWDEILEQAEKGRGGSPYNYFLDKMVSTSSNAPLAKAKLVESFPGGMKSSRQFQKEALGACLSETVIAYLEQNLESDNQLSSHRAANPQVIFNTQEYRDLPEEKKLDLVTAMIADSHNRIIFREVHNSTDGIKVFSGKSKFRGHHSILHQTPHQASVYSQASGTYLSTWNSGEYVFEDTILGCIEELKNNRSSDEGDHERLAVFLTDFWDKNRDPQYGPALANTLSTQAPDIAIRQTLASMPEANDLDQRRLLSLLYRLELGKVGISHEGVEYLGRRFDLGQYNNPENFVQRLTADGKVGIFDGDKSLKGFFQITADDYLQSTGELIQKELIAITKDLLFYPKADESVEESARRAELLEVFCAKYFNVFLQLFTNKSALHFNDLNLKEQGWVLLFLDTATMEQRGDFFQFAERWGEKGVRTFVAMEYGDHMGQQILDHVKNMSSEQAGEFLYGLADIVTQAEALGNAFKEGIPNGAYLSGQITEAILRKNKDFIRAADQVSAGKIEFDSLTEAMQELSFVLGELSEALQTNVRRYQVTGHSYDQPGRFTTWQLQEGKTGYKVNLTVRPEATPTIVEDKITGANKEIMAQAGIRATFVWPDKRKFGIRLDLDPHYQDEHFSGGRLALDLGNRESALATILDVVAPEEGGHHNAQSFAPQFSDPRVFVKLAESVNQYLERLSSRGG